MAKKYISLEEAARELGMAVEELNRLREKGDIRGFADRGAWKFKTEDVTEFGRSRQVDSSPEVPMLNDPVTESAIDVDEELGQQETVIRQKQPDEEQHVTFGDATDSDVRLILDDSLVGEDPAASPNFSDSDSDVRLSDQSDRIQDTGSDSDVKLVSSDSDSDIRIAPQFTGSGKPGSGAGEDDQHDTGVLSMGDAGSDSDVKLVGSDVSGGDSDFDLDLLDDDDDASVFSDEPSAGDADDAGMTIAAGSGISLGGAGDSGISLESDDSGIALESLDSSISLQSQDSGITLPGSNQDESSGDSSFVLDSQDESGISLSGMADSGISLVGEEDDLQGGSGDSGLALSADHPTDETIPIMGSYAESSADQPTADSEFELEMISDEGEDANVILFDDDDDADDYSATIVNKKTEEIDVAEEDFYDEADDEFFDDELEVAPDALGEDDELEDLGEFDDEAEGSFVSGGHEGFAVPGRVAAPSQAEWGVGTFVGLLLSTSMLVLCGIVMYDLVRAMWGWQEPTAINSTLLDQLRGLFES